MSLDYSFDIPQLKQDLRWLWDKIRTATILWYIKQVWLHNRIPFVWYEEAKLLRDQLYSANQELAEFQRRVELMDSSLDWAMNSPTLNTSAKTTALWLYSVLHPDVVDVSRVTVETAARKR